MYKRMNRGNMYRNEKNIVHETLMFLRHVESSVGDDAEGGVRAGVDV